MKVMIVSGGRFESQANMQVRQSIADGWADLLGEENVVTTNIVGAAGAVSSLKPDIMLGIGSYLPESTYFTEVSQRCRDSGAQTVFWATEDPYEQDASYRVERDFDLVLSCDRWGVNFYDSENVLHLPLGGCRRRHHVPIIANARQDIDIMFCGVAFASRKDLFCELRPAMRGLNVAFVGPGWGEFGHGCSDRRIEKHELIRLYGNSKIVLNLGRSLHFENKRYQIAPSTPGPRTFEAALAGTVQFFHEDTHEIRNYFDPDEIPCFSTRADFEALLERFAPDRAVRDQTAHKAQERALRDHTYTRRAQTIINTLISREAT